MSLDNVLGVAAAAKGNLVLLILGLGISVPLIIYGSQMILKLMERFPFIITAGAALLGWVAGEMAVGDPAVKDWIDANMPILHYAVPTVGAILVVLAGRWLNNRARAAHAGQAQEAVVVDGEPRKEGAAS
jgi:predicted tellurium resistance membrane protein TerC